MTIKKPKALVIGLTGGIGSGKTAVSNRLGELGATIIDTDEIAHRLTQSGGLAMADIRDTFGDAAIRPDGGMDRDYIRSLVFEKPEQRAFLEKILHPRIREAVGSMLQEDTSSYFVIVVPLLFEKGGWGELMDDIIVIDCPIEQQISRVIKRNGWAEAQVRAVINNQASRATRLGGAQHVIENTGDLPELIEKIDFLHKKLIKKARN